MFKFWNKITALNKVAKSMNGLNLKLKEVLARIDEGDRSDDLKSEVLFLVFVSKYGVIDRIHKYSIPFKGGINIPSFGMKNVDFRMAYSKTVGKVGECAETLGIEDEAENILTGGKLYDEFLNQIPESQLNKI